MRFFLLILVGLFFSTCTTSPLRKQHTWKDTVAHTPIDQHIPLSHGKETGVYMLECGGQSLAARLWLFEHAQHTIDINYYSVAKDVTGLVVSETLIRAADRGVKVRLLIDDAASKMYNHAIRLLDSHDNIEIRVYNAGLKLGSFWKRFPHMLRNGNRLLRRMHNKSLVVDNKICMTGGRNIADEYYDFDKKYNFRDRDVMLIGDSVSARATASFELFWNDQLTVPYSKLSRRINGKFFKKPSRYDHFHFRAADTAFFPLSMRRRISQFPQTLREAERLGELIRVENVSFVSDKPGKNEDRDKREGGATTDSLVNLIKNARRCIDIETPYFITTDASDRLISESVKRGVKFRLLTNSLASIDNPDAFSGYCRQRKKILSTGIELFEFKPNAQVRYKLMVPDKQEKINYRSIYGFHAKTLLIDSAIAVVGSYNFDPRSANYNTECIAIIRSDKVVQMLLAHLNEELKQENSWHVAPGIDPDKKAPLLKRIKALCWRILPKDQM